MKLTQVFQILGFPTNSHLRTGIYVVIHPPFIIVHSYLLPGPSNICERFLWPWTIRNNRSNLCSPGVPFLRLHRRCHFHCRYHSPVFRQLSKLFLSRGAGCSQLVMVSYHAGYSGIKWDRISRSHSRKSTPRFRTFRWDDDSVWQRVDRWWYVGVIWSV